MTVLTLLSRRSIRRYQIRFKELKLCLRICILDTAFVQLGLEIIGIDDSLSCPDSCLQASLQLCTASDMFAWTG